MARKKVRLAFIEKYAERKASFRKRKKGLIKKVEELSTLCGVDAFLIIYSPYDDAPEVWPPSSESFQNALSRFQMFPENQKLKNMVNQEGYEKQRNNKMQQQIKKQQNENREKEINNLIYKCLGGEKLQNFSLADLMQMDMMIQRNLYEISARIAYLKKNAPPQPAAPVLVNMPVVVPDQMGMNEMQNLNSEMEMLRITNEELGLDSFVWPDDFLLFLPNDDGAGPSNSNS